LVLNAFAIIYLLEAIFRLVKLVPSLAFEGADG